MKFKNPVIRGMNPDPSVCAANGTFYLVTSSFNYFPGIPIYESDDLINWRQIGHCLTRSEQLPLEGATISSGIFAPTIRFYDGVFYVVCTNTSGTGNFLISANNPSGEWSDIVKIGQDGIDPSLFFDDDGTAYFMSNGNDESGRPSVLCAPIDLTSGKLLQRPRALWHGTGGRFLEGPHLYKIDATYYIIAAEGGTEYGHTSICARSKNLWGEYESCPRNPVLTNRDKGGYELQGAGHGDLVQAADGSWWFLHLAFRQQGKWLTFHQLGRETCAEKVEWRDGWPVIGAEGVALLQADCPDSHNFAEQNFSFKKTFASIQKSEWNYLRNPDFSRYEFGRNSLRLFGTEIGIESGKSPTFLAIRQSEFSESISVTVTPNETEAGISIFMDESHHYDVSAKKCAKGIRVSAKIRIGPAFTEKSLKIDDASEAQSEARLYCDCSAEQYSLGVESGGKRRELFCAQSRYLSSEVAGGFTGVMLALFAVGKGAAEFKELIIEHKES